MDNKVNFNPNVVNLKTILGNGRYYSVPTFQRDYSWDESNWEELWNDILSLYKNRDEHYMGDILLKEKNKEEFEIIDGQQRITTISLLIYAISKFLDYNGHKDLSLKTKEEFLQKRKIGGLSYEPKLVLNRVNSGYYSILLDQENPQKPSPNEQKTNKLIYSAYDFFYKKINENFGVNDTEEIDIEEIDKFLHSFARDLIFIEIIVTTDENAFLIFETVNARGKTLTPVDMIKNYILSFGADETTLGYWNKISETLDNQFLSYIKHYLNTQFLDKFTEKDVFKVFRRHFDTPDAIKEFLQKSYYYSDFYISLSDPTSSFWTQNYINNWQSITKNLAELKLFSSRITQYKSLLLGVYIGFGEKIEEVLDLVKNIIFRYNTISSKNPNDLTPVFNSLAYKTAHQEVTDFSQIKKVFEKVYVSDEEFVSIFSESTFNYSNPGSKKLIEYILYQIECFINGKKTFDLKNPIATVEHILPQNNENISNKELYKYLNNIANFTLLENSKNQEAKNLEFSHKIDIYTKSEYEITKSLSKYLEWEIEQIKDRQKYLSKIAKLVWRVHF